MSFFKAIIMGIIQGATEFLPVSSSGHLAIASNIFGMEVSTSALFEVLLHLGTLIAVCIIFWKDVKNLLINGFALVGNVFFNFYIWIRKVFLKDKHASYNRLITNAYRKFAALIIVSSVPTAAIAVILDKILGDYSNALVVPGICLIITALLLLLMDGKKGGKKRVKATRYSDAAIVGAVQGLATLPGLSRSGSTIATGLMLGFDSAYAVKYSFLASIPAILGANLYELIKAGSAGIDSSYIFDYLVGMVVAGVVGYFCIKWMLDLVKKAKYEYFGYYCGALGVISVFAYFVLGK